MEASKFTISRRINAGFTLLVLICAALGLFATFKMRTAATGATFLAGAVAPQTGIAANLRDASASAQVAMRSYALTGDAAQLDIATQHLAEVAASFSEADKLVAAHPELTVLRDGIKSAGEDLRAYRSGIEATKDNFAELAKIRQHLDASGATFSQELNKFIDSLRKK
jgi:CHASE3 domain sensor protein